MPAKGDRYAGTGAKGDGEGEDELTDEAAQSGGDEAMTPTIKAIETRYKGYRFRSRLEARWAVFFDALGLEWEYEKEGVVLPTDGPYLPDFWVQSWTCFVEVKPRIDEHDGLGLAVAIGGQLTDMSGFPSITLAGDVWPEKHRAILICPNREAVDNYNSFADCRKCNGVWLAESTNGDIGGCSSLGKCCSTEKWPMLPHDRPDSAVGRAYRSARSARFEHGEKP